MMVYWPHAVRNPMEANIEGKNIYFPKKKPWRNTLSLRQHKIKVRLEPWSYKRDARQTRKIHDPEQTLNLIQSKD